jgi:hypothetical protein
LWMWMVARDVPLERPQKILDKRGLEWGIRVRPESWTGSCLLPYKIRTHKHPI